MAGSRVISGAINSDAALVIRAEKLAIDSRYARIMKVMQSTEQQRPHLRRLGDQLGAWFTPFALILAGIAGLLSEEVRSLPCGSCGGDTLPSVRMAIPTAIIRAIPLAGTTCDHYQESSGARADRFLQDANLRQDRHANVRTADAYRNHLR